MDDEPTIKLTKPSAGPAETSSPPGRSESPRPLRMFPGIPFKKREKSRRPPNPTRTALILFLGFLVLMGGVLTCGYVYEKNVQQPISQFIHPVGQDGSYDAIDGRSWNLLLLGSDNDGKYSFPALLTQVMMVVHVDTANKSVYLVSIPRDSWVSIPQIGGMHKIDQAFFLGATQHNSFDDGVRIARLTIEQDYGIPIDRYGWVGLSGFAKVIDTLGGVDLDVIHPVVDDNYPNDTGKGSNAKDPYAYKRLYIPAGPQHLSGTQALEYVRSRHSDLVGDIGRTQRQQQILGALRLKLNVGNVLAHLSDLIKDLSGQVYTDLSEQEMIAFANFGRTLDNGSIKRITLGPGSGNQDFGNYASVFDPSTNSNQDVIIPNCKNIQPVVSNIFQTGFFSGGCNVT
ncbi:MAG: LCP family protein [Ktedonobacteraceae bacterium]|nr:LCP family protein [Ktedonobacteraceae bacterium]